MSGALSGFRVLDLSRILAGPWASQMLADLGADVIKIERPQQGDDTRAWGPPYMPDDKGKPTTESAYFHGANRGKQSVCIDMSVEQGQELIRKLVVESDVLIENFKVGGLKKYGLDYESLKSINPKLVYCSITGFGQTGPYAERAGYDFMIQAMGGLMSVTGTAEGEPMKVGVALADVMTGLYAANAIQAALIHQLRTGEGQYIDLALLDVQVATLANQAMNYLASGENPKRLGNSHPNIVPYQAFQTDGGFIILAVGNDAQFSRFCELAKCPELANDARYQKNTNRVNNRSSLIPVIIEIMQSKTTELWLEQLNQKGIPCGPINNLDQVFADPQVQHREMQLELDHPTAGKVASVKNPINLSATPPAYDQSAPLLGQHTDQVLKQVLKIDPTNITALYEQGIIA
ncbi:MAG: crotonobetainyl-CoA:carnitine CoA-transferase CaiB-like acyl-CoA transferase [Gammaproteobacteria bacterium]|jgi:crotonobetainyl-CoA:carnitine CoA-transferase CaiB-like acyl-CoA transferase